MPKLPADIPHVTKNVKAFQRQLTELPAFRALLRAFESDFYQDLPLPAPILDLGCGDGHFASVTFDNKISVGLDPWWRPLQESKSHAKYKWLVHAQGGTTPFANESFATIISNSVLEHIESLNPVLHEVSRLLKPGGWFYFCVPSPQFRTYLSVARILDILHAFKLAEAYRRLFDRISRHKSYLTPDIWTAQLKLSGLVVTRWWAYFSPAALRALEWGHPLGLPTVIIKKLTGQWLLVPQRWNLYFTERILRQYYTEQPSTEGAYLFFVVHKPFPTQSISNCP
jgi:SAM-dependent methyltransferase